MQRVKWTGKRLGKTVFVYMTHDFDKACTDFSLMSQLDVGTSDGLCQNGDQRQNGVHLRKNMLYFALLPNL